MRGYRAGLSGRPACREGRGENRIRGREPMKESRRVSEWESGGHEAGSRRKNSGGDAPGGNTRTHPEHAARIYAGMLRPGRPMILYWRRYGKAGGCRIKKEKRKEKESRKAEGGLAQLGEHLPCKQGVESSNLLVSMAAQRVL